MGHFLTRLFCFAVLEMLASSCFSFHSVYSCNHLSITVHINLQFVLVSITTIHRLLFGDSHALRNLQSIYTEAQQNLNLVGVVK